MSFVLHFGFFLPLPQPSQVAAPVNEATQPPIQTEKSYFRFKAFLVSDLCFLLSSLSSLESGDRSSGKAEEQQYSQVALKWSGSPTQLATSLECDKLGFQA